MRGNTDLQRGCKSKINEMEEGLERRPMPVCDGIGDRAWLFQRTRSSQNQWNMVREIMPSDRAGDGLKAQ